MTFTGGLVKVGDGELYLAGAGNGYSGGTTVQAGTLRGNIAAGTDLALGSGAVYDGDGAARSVGELGGYGSVENTDELTVASGYFGGDIGGSNTGGLAKVGDGDSVRCERLLRRHDGQRRAAPRRLAQPAGGHPERFGSWLRPDRGRDLWRPD
jgi:autotransporter-associated beta strand protein